MKNIKSISALLVAIILIFSLVGCTLSDIPFIPEIHLVNRLSALNPWIDEISADEVSELRIEQNGYGMAPGSLDGVYYFTDTEVIADILTGLKNVTIRRATESESAVCGGSGISFKITDKNGKLYTLVTSNGFYYTDDAIYKLSGIPSIPREKASQKTCSFISYGQGFDIYTNTTEPEQVGIIDYLERLEFINCTSDDVVYAEPTHYIECWGNQKIYIYSDTVFSYCHYSDDTPTFYALQRGMSFKEFIRDTAVSKLTDFEPWLTDITPYDVVEIRTQDWNGNIAPIVLDDVIVTNNFDAISDYLVRLKTILLTDTGRDLPDGGNCFIVYITLNNGEEKNVSFPVDKYYYGGKLYEVEKIPELTSYDEITEAYTFNRIGKGFTLLTPDGENIGEGSGIDGIYFTKFDGTHEGELKLGYIVESDIGKLYVYSDKVFTYNDQWYVLCENLSFESIFSKIVN